MLIDFFLPRLYTRVLYISEDHVYFSLGKNLTKSWFFTPINLKHTVDLRLSYKYQQSLRAYKHIYDPDVCYIYLKTLYGNLVSGAEDKVTVDWQEQLCVRPSLFSLEQQATLFGRIMRTKFIICQCMLWKIKTNGSNCIDSWIQYLSNRVRLMTRNCRKYEKITQHVCVQG